MPEAEDIDYLPIFIAESSNKTYESKKLVFINIEKIIFTEFATQFSRTKPSREFNTLSMNVLQTKTAALCGHWLSIILQ